MTAADAKQLEKTLRGIAAELGGRCAALPCEQGRLVRVTNQEGKVVASVVLPGKE